MAVAHEASTSVRLEPAVSEAAERLYQEHSGWIYGYCLRLLRSPEEAEDALQVTYLNACRSLNDGIVPRVDSAWLLRIAQNVCLSRLRSSGRRARLEYVQDVTVLEETVAAPARQADELIGLTDALASLPEQQRRAILLREWQGLSYAEVGARLDLTQSAVEALIFRARRSLAKALEHPGKRRRLRFAHVLDVAGLYYALKSVFAGSAAAQVGAAAAVVATTATIAATDPAGMWRDRPEQSPPSMPASVEPGAPPAAGPGTVTRSAPVLAPELVAERRFFAHPGGPAAQNVGGRTFGQETAEKAREKGGNGKGKALGHAKQAEGKAKAKGPKKDPSATQNGNGSASGGGQGTATAPGQQKPKSEPTTGNGTGKGNSSGDVEAGGGEPPAPETVDSPKGKSGKFK